MEQGAGGRTGLNVRNNMRMGRWEGGRVGAYKNPRVAYCLRRRRQWRGEGGGERVVGEPGINRIVSIHPSGSSRDLHAPISPLHCLACRITRSLPRLSHPRVLKNGRLLVLQRLIFFFFFQLLIDLASFPFLRREVRTSVPRKSLLRLISNDIICIAT